MDITQIIQFFLHLNAHIPALVQYFGYWTYLIVFIIIFCETGLVFAPFLPGDSLLFLLGMVCAQATPTSFLNVHELAVVLILAAFLGDTLNYSVGRWFGAHIFSDNARFLKREYLIRAHAFLEKYGVKAVVLARFVPIIRTFIPFVAGLGYMRYTLFVTFNLLGAIFWVVLILYLGYFFGNVAWVKTYFSLVILMIIVVSVLPMMCEWIKVKKQAKKIKEES